MLYGLCVYSTFAVSWNETKQQLYAFRMKDHYERIVRSCRIMGFADYANQQSFEEFEKQMLELLRRSVDSTELSAPKSPVSEMVGNSAAFATPICAFAAISCSSARRISGRRSMSEEGSPAGTTGMRGCWSMGMPGRRR